MPENIPDNLEEQIKQLISTAILRPAEELKPETNFYNDLGVDSIKAIEIVVAIEKQFKVRIRDEQVTQINTVAEAINLVKKALENKQE